MTALTDSLDLGNEPFQLRGIDKLYRDKLIGAAGELFVSSSSNTTDETL
jgi:hypothetical protein